MSTLVATLVVTALGMAVFISSLLFPEKSLGAWLASALLVPYWVGLTAFGVFVPNVVFAMLCACAGLFLSRRPKTRLHAADLMWVLIAVVLLVMGSQGVADLSDVLSLLGLLLGGYVLARLAGSVISEVRSDRVLAVAAIALSVASVVEFAFQFHPFVGLLSDTTAGAIWSPVQVRGFYARSELTLGHSIALAITLSLLMPFALARAKTAASWLLVAAMGAAGIAVTFSRTGLVCGGIAIVLSLLASKGRMRFGVPLVVGAGVGAVGFALASFVLPTFAADEQLESSWQQRFKMLELFGRAQLIGAAGNAVPAVDGRIGYAGASGVYLTVDNWPLILSLQYGLIAGGLVVVLLSIVVIVALRKWRSSASVALISAVPAVFSVAMITQYAAIFWLVGGLVVGSSLRARVQSAEEPRAGATARAASHRRRSRRSVRPVSMRRMVPWQQETGHVSSQVELRQGQRPGIRALVARDQRRAICGSPW